jgi:acetyl-CoA carboxylase carboxyltransferase component
MPKKKARKKHSVRAFLQVTELAKAGSSLELNIYASREKIGTLIIGRGSLFWYGRSRQKRKRIAWSRFAEMMDDLAYGS